MKLRARLRSGADERLAAFVSEALEPTRIAALAHAEDWPGAPPATAPEALSAETWEHALGDIACDIIGRPGRRFRARLAEISFRLAGGRGEPPLALEALLEILHAGSLIVDDIEDGSTVRRGEPCLHVSYGLPLALNAGNWMYLRALQLVDALEPERPVTRDRIRRAVVDAMASCHLGQALDLSIDVGRLPRAAAYRTVATSTTLKTGALMELAALLGAIVGDAPAAHEQALARFGRRLGVGLQMLDDFGNLNAGADGRAGKALEDLRNGTPTWPWAFAAQALDDAAFGELQAAARAVAAGEADEVRLRALAAALRMAVGREGRAQASHYLAKAFSDLREQVGPMPELAVVAAEIRRLEVAYG